MFIIALLIILNSSGPVIHWSKRIGKKNKIFLMPKFRTMIANAPQKATDLIKKDDNLITKPGFFLRKSSLDEIPQLYSILKGDMNFIGPRPALFNQYDLIELRTKNNIHLQKPGITGWAQINGRDSISITKKVDLEKFYKENNSLYLNLKILFLTFINVLKRNSISH
tara:strand:- start:1128 stop:1628 length:501 start_codon:yes stop_codon:yes gene_type:complete